MKNKRKRKMDPKAEERRQSRAYIRQARWLRREVRKAAGLPITEMLPRLRELVARTASAVREVHRFLE